MIILRAYCAPEVIESASSSIITLWTFGGKLTTFVAKFLIFVLTTLIPLSSEAFSSKVASLNLVSRTSLHRQIIEVVLPQPGGPYSII